MGKANSIGADFANERRIQQMILLGKGITDRKLILVTRNAAERHLLSV